MKQISPISSQIFVLSDKDKLYYLLKGIDTEITPIFGKWLYVKLIKHVNKSQNMIQNYNLIYDIY